MIERAVYRLEERAGVALALLVRETRAAFVNALVHPAVIRRHRSCVGQRIHEVYRLSRCSRLVGASTRADFTQADTPPARANGRTVQCLRRNTAARSRRPRARTCLRQ